MVLVLSVLPQPRDRGQAALDRAVAALGGQALLTKLDGWVVSARGRENLSAEWQGRSIGTPTWRDHEEIVAAVGDAVAWERRTPRNDMSLRWRRFIYGRNASGFVDWNAGVGRLAPPGTPDNERRAMARRIPHLLVRDLSEAGARVQWTGERALEGTSHDVITAILRDGLTLRVFVSRANGAIGRVEYDAFLPGIGDSTVSWTWSDWTAEPAIGIKPGRQTIAVNDVPYQEVTFTRYGAGALDASSFVELPALKPSAMSMDVVASAGPATGEVAPGVHVRSIQGFNLMVIAGRDALTVVEAPEFARGLEAIPASNAARSGRAATEQAQWISSSFPGKPIGHLVISHHHGDHTGGLPLLARAGTTVVASGADAAAARHAVSASRRLAPWPAPPGSAPVATVEAVSGRRVIDDGVRRIEVLSTGENPHSDDNLLVWLPSERILFQGDLFYFDAGSPFPPSGRETMNRFFAKWLTDRGIQPRLIYGVHNGGAAGSEALARSR